MKANITHLAEILTLGRSAGIDPTAAKVLLTNKECHPFISEDFSLFFALVPANENGVYCMHIYSDRTTSLPDTKEFCFSCIREMQKEQLILGAFNVVKGSDLGLKMFMRYLGSKRVSKLSNGDVVYFSTPDQMEEK